MTWTQHQETLTAQQLAHAAAADILRDYERGDYTEAQAREWLEHMQGLATAAERPAFTRALDLLSR